MAKVFLTANSSVTVEESLASCGLSMSSDLRASSRSALDHSPITPVHWGNSIAPKPQSEAASDRKSDCHESRGENGIEMGPLPDQEAKNVASHLSALSVGSVKVALLDLRFSALRASCLKCPITAFRHGAAKDRKLITWNLVKGRPAFITNLKGIAEFLVCAPDGAR